VALDVITYTNGATPTWEIVLITVIPLLIFVAIPLAAIVDIARRPQGSFVGRMSRGGWIGLIVALDLLTAVGGVVMAIWWFFVTRRRLPLG